jgi:hypothetical protein
MTLALTELEADGWKLTPELLAAFSPFRTHHLNRFGLYELKDLVPTPGLTTQLGEAVPFYARILTMGPPRQFEESGIGQEPAPLSNAVCGMRSGCGLCCAAK